MEKGQIVEFTIEDMSSEGQGIGRFEGMVVFVDGAVIGDTVSARLKKVKKNYALAELVEVLDESPFRTDVFDCEFMEKGCGGCQYGCIDYGAQLKLKQSQVREKLQRLAGIEDPAVMPITGMKPEDNDGNGPFRYRNKAQFQVSTGGIITRKGGVVENLGEPAVGFYNAKSHSVVDCGDCYLQSMAAMAAADALRTFMEEDNITAWDPKWEKGLMRQLIVKTGFATKEVMVILVINGKGIPNAQKLIEMLDDAVYEVGYSLESVVINVKKEKKDENIVIAGKPVIRDFIGDVEYEISPSSFYQVNPVQVKRLYDIVRKYCGFVDAADVAGSHIAVRPVILDLYCGVGSIGLYCADMAEAVVGIESVREAVIDANRNAVINGIVNARYICGRAEEVLPEYAAAGTGDEVDVDPELARLIRRTDIAILDPPRAGCRPELLEAVAKVSPERIVYVSCDPATLSRDIRLLMQLGYEFVEASPVDMFPWSVHVECVSLLQKVK